jgi:hypothetical protein
MTCRIAPAPRRLALAGVGLMLVLAAPPAPAGERPRASGPVSLHGLVPVQATASDRRHEHFHRDRSTWRSHEVERHRSVTRSRDRRSKGIIYRERTYERDYRAYQDRNRRDYRQDR